jgi:hypothetical protein
MSMPGKKLKFPDPKDYPAKDSVILCPADRAIRLYNQATGLKAKKIAKKLTEWFVAEAKNKGWAERRFVPEVQSKHGAGCILLNPLSVTINIHNIVIKVDA